MCNNYINKLIKIFKKRFLCINYTFVSKVRPFNIEKNFKEFIDDKYLLKIFYDKFQFSNDKGIDGKSANQLNVISHNNKINDFEWISNSLKNRNYKFNNYQQILINKGKNKYPRIVAKPTIRDKIVLYSIKEYFRINIKESIRKQPNEVIDLIVNQIKTINNFDDIILYKTDIKGFYDEISKKILLQKLDIYLDKERDKHKILDLLKNILDSEIIPFGTKKKSINYHPSKKGIPQGLSISNILANLYMFDLDNYFNYLVEKKELIGYHRYVDDILIIVPRKKIKKTICKLKSKVANLELDLHINEKTETINLKEKDLVFLGYVFKYKENFYSKHSKLNNLLIIPRDESKENFFKSIMSMFSKYQKNISEIKRLSDEKEKKLKFDLLNKNLIFRLNIKISGCIAEGNKYGFFAYFSKTTSPYFAYTLKNIIKKEIQKIQTKHILSKDELKIIFADLKDPISAYFSTQDIKFFKRNVIINFDDYMDFQEYVLNKHSEIEDTRKISPAKFLVEYDSEYYEHLYNSYEGYELRKKIYSRFNEIKNKNLDLLNKDISGNSSGR